jgi:hypothetical protein
MDISFAWTTPALVADRKRCTRRDWSADYAARFREGFRALGIEMDPESARIARARLDAQWEVKLL